MRKLKFFLINLTVLLTLISTSSCGVVTSGCTSLLKSVKSKEMFGQILFGEFELQQNRFLQSSSQIRYKESVVNLLNNYIEVQKLILDKPECLVKPELQSALQDGIPEIEAKIIRANLSHEAAFIEMRGELSEAHYSLELWIKK